MIASSPSPAAEPSDGPLAPYRALGRGGRQLLFALLLASFALDIWYAHFWPSQRRWWDERYNARNVVAAISGDPDLQFNGYYPPLTWAPQAAALGLAHHVAALFGRELVPWEGRQLSDGALRFCRYTAAATGAATLFLVFLLAGRLFDPWTGLGAVALLGFCPWHLNSSAMFKPDAPLAFTSALAALAVTEAARGATRDRYLAMAAAIALAASAKQTGIALALPGLLVVLAQSREERVWRQYVPQAAATGLGLLVLLNFPLYFLRDDLETIVRFYAKRQQQTGETRWTALREMSDWVLDWTSFGALLGIAALVGLAIWAFLALRGRRRGELSAWPRLAGLAVPLAYTGTYLALTAHFKENNFLPVLQSLAIAASLLAMRAAGLAARALPPGLARTTPAIVFGLLVGARGAVAFDYAYRSVTPTTFDVLMSDAERRGLLDKHSVVLTEWLDDARVHYELEQGVPGDQSVAVRVPSLAALSAEERQLADGEVGLLTEPSRANRQIPDGIVLRAEPRLGKVRGPALEGHFHAWPDVDEAVGYDSEHTAASAFVGSVVHLPRSEELAAGDYLQFVVWLGIKPRGAEPPPAPRAWNGEAPLLLHDGHAIDRGMIWSSRRWRACESAPQLRLELPKVPGGERWAVAIYRWRGASGIDRSPTNSPANAGR